MIAVFCDVWNYLGEFIKSEYMAARNTEMMRFREKLSGRLQMDDLHEMCFLTQGSENNDRKESLYQLIFDKDARVSYNALWVFTHFDQINNKWLYNKHDDLIDVVMEEVHEGKKRLMLTLLLRQPFDKDCIRTDFLDFCFNRIMSASEAYAIRALCMKLAYKQCRYYPELLEELRICLDRIGEEPLSSGLKTARKNVMKAICKSSMGA